MSKSIFLKSLFLLVSALAFPAQAAKQELLLFKIFKDSNHSVPAQDLPYRLQLDGRHLKRDLTDKSGAIITDQRQLKTRQEFVADIWGMGTYVLVIDTKNRISVKYLGDLGASDGIPAPCSPAAGNCTGKGFYWIRLLGLNSKFASEPYSLTLQGKTVEGTVDANGYLFVPMNTPPSISDAITLRLCAGPAFSIKVGTDIKDSESAMFESSNARPPSLQSCKSSSLKNYTRRHVDLNRGMPYIFSEWAIGSMPTELAERRRSTEQALQDDYKALAAANNDQLSWLGTLPATWSKDEYTSRQDKFLDLLKANLKFDMEDLLQFQCRTPEQVGPIPNMDAVEAYIGAYSSGTPDQEQLARLYNAAAKGNWLAVAQVYAYEEAKRDQEDDNPYLHNYRSLQLAEWLQARKIGAIYTLLGDALNSSGYITDAPYYYAALHNSYSSQYKMGATLQNAPDIRYRDIGQKMQACALNALPAYRKYFESTGD